jgi:opacity protein-like surface antigen
MKKLVLALILAITATTAVAADNFAHVQYTLRDTVADDKDNPNRQGANFTLGRTVYPGVTIDVNSQFRTERLNSDTGSSSQRLEAGVSYAVNLTNDISVYTRGALGHKFTATEDHTYYSIEPGIKARLTEPLAVKVGYRYRDATNSAADQTNTLRLGAEYEIGKNQLLTAGIDRSWGDSEFIGYNAGYVVKF